MDNASCSEEGSKNGLITLIAIFLLDSPLRASEEWEAGHKNKDEFSVVFAQNLYM